MNDIKINDISLVDKNNFIKGYIKIIPAIKDDSMIMIEDDKTMIIVVDDIITPDGDLVYENGNLVKTFIISTSDQISDIISDYKKDIKFDEINGEIKINGDDYKPYEKTIWFGQATGKPVIDTIPNFKTLKVLMSPSGISKNLYNDYVEGLIVDGDDILIKCHRRGDDYYVNNPISYTLLNNYNREDLLEKEPKLSPENFTYWLQGLLEGESSLSSDEQIKMIDEHLQLVFTKVTTKKRGLPHFC